MNDYQPICPHCGKPIEPGYYAYDQKVQSRWLELANYDPVKKMVEDALQEIAKKIMWTTKDTPGSE